MESHLQEVAFLDGDNKNKVEGKALQEKGTAQRNAY